MKTRIIIHTLLACPLVLSACNGPTRTGIEARDASYGRVNLMNAQINYDQAKKAFTTGEFDKALREIDFAIERAPDQASYQVLRGRILMESHRLEYALDSFDKAIEIDPALAEAHYFRGVVFERWSDDERAVESYSAAFQNDSANLQYLLATTESLVALNRLDTAKSMLETKLTVFEHHAAIYELLGRVALLRNDPSEAADRLSRACVLSSDDPALRRCLANAQFQAGRFDACLQTIAELQRGESKPNVDLLRMKARCLDQSGRTEDARAIYSDLTSRDPSDLQSWIELAGVAHALGDSRRVGLCGARIVALAPERYEGYMFKAIAEQGVGHQDKAIALLRQATVRSKSDAAPHLLLGHLLRSIGDTNGAAASFANAVRVDPGSEKARAMMAQVEEK